MTLALIGFAVVLLLVLIRMPIVFAMGLVGTVGYMGERGFKWRHVDGRPPDYGHRAELQPVGYPAFHPDGPVCEQGRA